MEEILRLARALGEAIARHPHYAALREAEEAAAANPQVASLVQEFNRQQERMGQNLRDRKPIEPEDKRKLAHLQQQVMASDVLKKLQAAQVNFKHLMDTMNRAIHEALEPPEKEAAP